MGQWLEKYGYTIYETRGGPFKPTDWGVSTRKNNKIYLHILKWSGDSPAIIIPDVGIKIKKLELADGGKIRYSKEGNSVIIVFDAKLLRPVNTIVEIEYADNIMNVKPVDLSPRSVSYMKNVTSSSNQKAQWINHQWVDLEAINNGDWSGSFWQAAHEDRTPWVEFDLGRPEMLSKAILYESGDNIKSYELQYKQGDTWKTLYKGNNIGTKSEIKFEPAESRIVRLLISSYTGTLQIYEVMLLK